MNYSVIIAYFNGQKYFKSQLDSIINQSIPPKKILIVDDNSNENRSVDQINNIPKILNGINIVVNQNQKNQGPSWTFINGIKQLDEDLIFLADQDDVWDTDKAKIFFEKIKELEVDIREAFLLFSDLKIINNKGEIKESSFFRKMNMSIKNLKFKHFFKNNYIPGCSMAITNKMSKLLMHYNYDHCIMHDHVISLLAFSLEKVVFINLPLVSYRSHENEVTSKEIKSIIPKFWNLKYIQSKINSKYTQNYLTKQIVQLQEFRSAYLNIIPAEKVNQLQKFVKLSNKPFIIRWIS